MEENKKGYENTTSNQSRQQNQASESGMNRNEDSLQKTDKTTEDKRKNIEKENLEKEHQLDYKMPEADHDSQDENLEKEQIEYDEEVEARFIAPDISHNPNADLGVK